MPANSRAADVARDSIDRVIAIQNKKYDNAFQVQGFQAVLYSKLKGGTVCLCHGKQGNLRNTGILDADGNASMGTINRLLTGQNFGILPYGQVPAVPFGVIETGGDPTLLSLKAPSIYDMDEPEIRNQPIGTVASGFSSTGSETGVHTSIADGFDDTGPVTGAGTYGDELIRSIDSSGFDSFSMGASDVSCPICFGSGYVGGFSIHNGTRIVLDSQMMNSGAIVYSEEFVPSMEATGTVIFKPVILPRGAVGLDSLKVCNGTKVVPVKFYLDGVLLQNDISLLNKCDGLPHVLSITVMNEDKVFTHVEIQYNQSTNAAMFDFPKLMQGSTESLIERTDSFSIVMSPVIPNVSNGDIITDSTYGKTFQVNTSNWWNDKRRAVLGWECEVRPVQPQELFSLLPKRGTMQSQKTTQTVRSNLDKKY